MSEKTEQPTGQKLRKSREKGQVAKSADLTNAFLLLAAAAVLSAGGALYVARLRTAMAGYFAPSMLTGEVAEGPLLERFGDGLLQALTMTSPLVVAVALMAAALQFLQVKALFAPQVIQPKFDKLNPVEGFRNIFFKAKTWVDLLKNLVKLAVIAALVYYELRGDLRDVLLTARVEPAASASLAGHMLFRLLYKAGAAFLVIGAADYMIQNKFHRKDLMMSKDEVKREYKESEGDPHLKHARKQFHDEMLSHSAVGNVPRASAVVVNPTHVAVAIEYDEATMGAPTVTAKGREELAGRIRELAREHHIPVIRNIGLARSLYAVDLGAEIPEELYDAVAEVLHWVYELAERGEKPPEVF
ncbi:MAG: EscU/YscU/HrcU family type III secretion system export apparatus switch protein [Bryobacteraceae bacterium]